MIICLGLTPAYQRTMIFDRLTLDAVNRAREVRAAASGKGTNVARVLTAMGRDALATGVLGGGAGRLMRADMDRAGIRHDFVEVRGETRICTTLVDRAGGTATELVEEPAPIGENECDAMLAMLSRHLAGGDVAVFSGSLPGGVGDGFYRECVERAAAADVKVVLDARGAAMLEALRAGPFVVKINRQELAETMGVDAEDEGAVRKVMAQVVEMGAKWVIATMGPEGALVGDGRAVWRVHAPVVRAVNPIGSGDAFAAGLAAGLSDGRSVVEACPLAAACAAANAMTDQAGFIDALYLADLQRQTKVERHA